jgi:DNA-binding XRE family transcriptional regulator
MSRDPATPESTDDRAERSEQETAEQRARRMRNNVKKLREDRLLSKAELARKAGVSALTIDRVEAGMPCRMDTKRKIILALGMTVAEKDKVFTPGDDDETEQGDPQGG